MRPDAPSAQLPVAQCASGSSNFLRELRRAPPGSTSASCPTRPSLTCANWNAAVSRSAVLWPTAALLAGALFMPDDRAGLSEARRVLQNAGFSEFQIFHTAHHELEEDLAAMKHNDAFEMHRMPACTGLIYPTCSSGVFSAQTPASAGRRHGKDTQWRVRVRQNIPRHLFRYVGLVPGARMPLTHVPLRIVTDPAVDTRFLRV